jgi:hypothetical protein
MCHSDVSTIVWGYVDEKLVTTPSSQTQHTCPNFQIYKRLDNGAGPESLTDDSDLIWGKRGCDYFKFMGED